MKPIGESKTAKSRMRAVACGFAACALACALGACGGAAPEGGSESALDPTAMQNPQGADQPQESSASSSIAESSSSSSTASVPADESASIGVDVSPNADQLRSELDISEDYRKSFVHGKKPAKYQKYIMLHDTEGDGDAASVVKSWDNSGEGVAAHFIVNKDGSIVQCVKMNKITHHAGYGDAGHNEKFDVEDESRDDKKGTVAIGSDYPDYGMNSYSIGIEIVHIGGKGKYPKAQLEALDKLIAYIDAYYGFESEIIDHKMWRTTNPDTSKEFAKYLKNYRDHRSYKKAKAGE